MSCNLSSVLLRRLLITSTKAIQLLNKQSQQFESVNISYVRTMPISQLICKLTANGTGKPNVQTGHRNGSY